MPTHIRTRALGTTLRETTIRVTYEDFTAAALTEAVDMFTAKSNAVLLAAYIDLREAFATAGSHTSMALEVGSTADPNSLLVSTDLFGAPVARYRNDGGPAEAFSSLAVKVKATSDVNLGDGADSALNAGIADITFMYTIPR